MSSSSQTIQRPNRNEIVTEEQLMRNIRDHRGDRTQDVYLSGKFDTKNTPTDFGSQNLDADLGDLEKYVVTTNERIKEVESQVEDLQSINERIEEVDSELEELQSIVERIEDIETRIEKFQSTNESVDEMETKIGDIHTTLFTPAGEDRIEILEGDISEAQDKIETIENNIKDIDEYVENKTNSLGKELNEKISNTESNLDRQISAVHDEVMNLYQTITDAFVWPITLGLALFASVVTAVLAISESLAFVPTGLIAVLLWIGVAGLMTEDRVKDKSL